MFVEAGQQGRIRNYLVLEKGLDAERVIALDGGFRNELSAEVVPAEFLEARWEGCWEDDIVQLAFSTISLPGFSLERDCRAVARESFGDFTMRGPPEMPLRIRGTFGLREVEEEPQ
jgi:hypothetical protein